jgi:hypothetical protein
MLRPEVVFFSNGPGEVMGWLAPVLHHLRDEPALPARITVVIPPCDFASGREPELVKSLGGVDQIIPPSMCLKSLLFGPRAAGLVFGSDRGVVVHLGGDHLQSGLMAKRLRYRAIAYTEGKIHHKHYFDLIATDYEQSREMLLEAGVPPEQVVVVGNLMVDAVSLHADRLSRIRSIGLDLDRPIVGLLPGSRPRWLDITMGLLLGAADRLRARMASVQFVLLLAPTVTFSDVSRVVQQLGMSLVPEKAGSGSSHSREGHIVTSGGTKIVVGASNRYDTMSCMDVAVTLPGTNTMELAALGIPMVVVVPLNDPGRIPLEGLPGLIGGIPYIGPYLKAKAVARHAAKTVFTALPNIRAGEGVVPEVRGVLAPEDISGPVEGLLVSESMRDQLSQRLKSIAGSPGASKRLASLIADQLLMSENR